MEIWGILHFEMKVGEGGNDYWFLLNELLFQLLFSFYSVLLCSLTEHINVLGLFFFFYHGGICFPEKEYLSPNKK